MQKACNVEIYDRDIFQLSRFSYLKQRSTLPPVLTATVRLQVVPMTTCLFFCSSVQQVSSLLKDGRIVYEKEITRESLNK